MRNSVHMTFIYVVFPPNCTFSWIFSAVSSVSRSNQKKNLHIMSGQWSHGLFGCFGDITTCKLRSLWVALLVLVAKLQQCFYGIHFPLQSSACVYFWILCSKKTVYFLCFLVLRWPGLITFFFPCYTAGKNAEGVGEDCIKHGVFTVIPLLGIYCAAVIRGKIRDKKGIEVWTWLY